MGRYKIRIGETIATLVAEHEYYQLAISEIHRMRSDLIAYISGHPEFRGALSPLSVSDSAPPIVRRMADASSKVAVGPMAAVAGAIGQYVVEGLIGAGAKHVIFDNGGDIAMHLDHPIIIGIYTGPYSIEGLGLRVTRTHETLGVCTSSGTVGHSMSLGLSDASVVVSGDVALADAAATALGNAIASRDPDLMGITMQGLMVPGVDGMLTVIGDTLGVCGRVPEVVRARVDFDLISRGLEVVP
jgi:ApbE superfamily uncharacterized protein (UPF0280 family)